jgi:hypothetical protein
MTKIEKKDYGFKLTFAGSINPDEMASWVDSSKTELSSQTSKFGILVDMRELSPLSPGAKEKCLKDKSFTKKKA